MDKNTISDIVDLFKSAGFNGWIFRNEKAALAHIESHNFKPIRCPYKGEPRNISPPVCEWHWREKDNICTGCEHSR